MVKSPSGSILLTNILGTVGQARYPGLRYTVSYVSHVDNSYASLISLPTLLTQAFWEKCEVRVEHVICFSFYSSYKYFFPPINS